MLWNTVKPHTIIIYKYIETEDHQTFWIQAISVFKKITSLLTKKFENDKKYNKNYAIKSK